MSTMRWLMLSLCALVGAGLVGSAVSASAQDAAPDAKPAAAPGAKPPKVKKAVELPPPAAGEAAPDALPPGAKPPKVKKAVELPPPVAQAVAAAFPKGTVDKVKAKDGQVFEIDIKGDQPGLMAMIAADGMMILSESDVAAKDLPPAIAQAVQKAVEGAEVTGGVKQDVFAEKGKDGKLVPLDKPKTVFQLDLKNAAQKGSMTVAGDGTVVGQPKWKAAKPPKDAAVDASGNPVKPTKPVQAPDASAKPPADPDPAPAAPPPPASF